MVIKKISEDKRQEFNSVVNHPLQAYEWGEFREKTGLKVIRRGFFDPSAGSGQTDKDKILSGFQLTIHPIPHTSYSIGYLPKGDLPTKDALRELYKIGQEEKCIFIQLEPNVRQSEDAQWKVVNLGLREAAHPLFTKYSFILDLTKSEEEILREMHQKARYNIKIAKKYEVEVVEDNSKEAFEEYLRLTKETTERQKFYAHSESYHRQMWETLRSEKQDSKKLTAHLLTARYQGKILTTWILFVFKDTLYYPYGASSSENREVMSSNLVMWEAIKFGKRLGLKKFDMWGAMGPNPDTKDPWYGFHTFKQKYGPEHVEFVGSYDLVISSVLYSAYKIADKLRWVFLRLKK